MLWLEIKNFPSIKFSHRVKSTLAFIDLFDFLQIFTTNEHIKRKETCGEGRQNVKRIISLKKDEYSTFDFFTKIFERERPFAFSVYNFFQVWIRKIYRHSLKNLFKACKEYSCKLVNRRQVYQFYGKVFMWNTSYLSALQPAEREGNTITLPGSTHCCVCAPHYTGLPWDLACNFEFPLA